MTRATSRPVVRLVHGGTTVGDLVVELRNDTVTLKPKGKRREAAVVLSWNSVYVLACKRKGDAVIEERRERRVLRKAGV